MKNLAVLSRTILIILVGCLLPVAHQAEPDERLAERGSQLLKPLKLALMEELRSSLKHGLIEAVESCRIEAPRISSKLANDQVRLGRTSDRLRNPSNKAPGWTEPILESYLMDPLDRSPKIVRLSDQRIGYTEPIATQPLCLNCHGASITPSVIRKIKELYPEDRASGFKTGDLRGIFWVEFLSLQ